MKTMLLLITLLVSLSLESWAQKPTSSPDKLSKATPCVPRQTTKRTRRPGGPPPVPLPIESAAADFFVGEAMVEVTKDQTVVRLAMAQHASVLIELPANDGPRYIIPGDPEMVTVDEKALEKNKRAIIVRPGSLFVVSLPNQRNRAPAATVTAQMRSGLVVTFLFYSVADLVHNVPGCVLTYKRDEVVARRRAVGLPVNLDQKEQGGEKPTGQSGAPGSISVELVEELKRTDTGPSNNSSVGPKIDNPSQPPEVKPNATQPSHGSVPVVSGNIRIEEHAVAATKEQLARALAEPGAFKNWTRPLHGLALAALQ